MLAFVYRLCHKPNLIPLLSIGFTSTLLFAHTEILLPPPIPAFAAGMTANTARSRNSVQPESAEKHSPEKTADCIRKWREAVEKVRQLECSFEINGEDRTFGTIDREVGTYQFLKVKQQTETKSYYHLDLKRVSQKLPSRREIICDKFYHIIPDKKYISIVDYKKLTVDHKKKMRSDFFSSIELGIIEALYEVVKFISDPNQILEKFAATLEKEDQYYLYIHLYPKLAEDQSAISLFRLVILKSTFLPRQVSWISPNDTFVTLNFTQMNLSPVLKPSNFAPLDMQKFNGWRIYERDFDCWYP